MFWVSALSPQIFEINNYLSVFHSLGSGRNFQPPSRMNDMVPYVFAQKGTDCASQLSPGLLYCHFVAFTILTELS